MYREGSTKPLLYIVAPNCALLYVHAGNKLKPKTKGDNRLYGHRQFEWMWRLLKKVTKNQNQSDHTATSVQGDQGLPYTVAVFGNNNVVCKH